MKIALLFFGQLRWHDFANYTFMQNFFPALQGHDVKYFGHFCNDDNLSEFQKMYQPNIIQVAPQKSLQEIKELFNNKINKVSENLPKQLESLYEVSKLVQKYQEENNTKFDLYIKIRTDLGFLEKINIDNFDNNSIYVGKTDRNLLFYVQDFVLFTKNFQNMKDICEMGFHLDSILKELEKQEMRNLYYHEEVLAKYILMKNISCKTHNFNIDLARHHS